MHASNFSNYLKISNDFLQNSIIMSYGPQLPPHLMKSKRPTDSDEDSDSDEGQDGPKLPSQPCLGPRPPANIGPQLPSTHTTQDDKDESSDEDDEAYGPKLPSQPCFGPRPPPQCSNDIIGPQIPTSFQSSSSRKDDTNEDSSDDDEMIGPMPPKPGEEVSTEDYHRRNFEERASRMQDKLEGKNKVEEPKREDW